MRLDFGKPSLGVVSTPDKQRPGQFGKKMGIFLADDRYWDGSGVEFAPSLCTVHRQRETDLLLPMEKKFDAVVGSDPVQKILPG